MAVLKIDKSTNYTGQVLDDIGLMDFVDGVGDVGAVFNASQFDGVQIDPDVEIIGNSAQQRLIINCNEPVDASNWQFKFWTSSFDIVYFQGDSENNLIVGTVVADSIFGGGGSDTVDAGAGNDSVLGGEGNDRLDGGKGKDTVIGGSGSDIITSSESGDNLDADGADQERGAGLALLDDAIDAIVLRRETSTSAFNIDIAANPADIGDGTFISGFESIQWFGGSGGATVTGGGAGDLLTGGSGIDRLTGASGDDQIDGSTGGNRLDGGAGNDILFGETGSTGTMIGGSGADIAKIDHSGAIASVTFGKNGGQGLKLFGIETLNVTSGGGNDRLSGAVGNDLLTAGNGNDFLVGAAGVDSLNGNDANDTVIGGGGADFLFAGLGLDTLNYAASAAVTVNLSTNSGSGGHAAGDFFSQFERVVGSAFNDLLIGDGLANILVGGNGADSLEGGFGNDELQAGNGNDVLVGSAGKDVQSGGGGKDTYVFQSLADSAAGIERDFIRSFTQGSDIIDLGAIDVIAGGSDDDFNFIGKAAFSGAIGELRFYRSSGVTFVEADASGDKSADFQIGILGFINLAGDDFKL